MERGNNLADWYDTIDDRNLIELLAEGRHQVKTDIDQSAWRLTDFLERNNNTEVFKFPHSFSFPTNCCQGSSLLFKLLLEEKYGIERAKIIKGRKRRKHEFHYWVELDGNIYDLSGHQFRGVPTPIVGESESKLKKRFPIQVEDQEYDFLDRDEVLALHRGDGFGFGH